MRADRPAGGYGDLKRYGVPVYFYEAAAARPDRALLEDVRKGQFEGLREAVKRDASRRPDVGGPDLHPTAGASAVGARRFLIAYNIYLDTPDVTLARSIAREIRGFRWRRFRQGAGRSQGAGGLRSTAERRSRSTSPTFAGPGVGVVFDAVKRLALVAGARPVTGELIGLLPQAAYEPGKRVGAAAGGLQPGGQGAGAATGAADRVALAWGTVYVTDVIWNEHARAPGRRLRLR